MGRDRPGERGRRVRDTRPDADTGADRSATPGYSAGTRRPSAPSPVRWPRPGCCPAATPSSCCRTATVSCWSPTPASAAGCGRRGCGPARSWSMGRSPGLAARARRHDRAALAAAVGGERDAIVAEAEALPLPASKANGSSSAGRSKEGRWRRYLSTRWRGCGWSRAGCCAPGRGPGRLLHPWREARSRGNRPAGAAAGDHRRADGHVAARDGPARGHLCSPSARRLRAGRARADELLHRRYLGCSPPASEIDDRSAWLATDRPRVHPATSCSRRLKAAANSNDGGHESWPTTSVGHAEISPTSGQPRAARGR